MIDERSIDVCGEFILVRLLLPSLAVIHPKMI